MAISDKLKKLQTDGQPKTLDELFTNSKEGMLLERVKNAVNMLLPAMRETLKKELKTELADELKNQVGQIKVRDGKDGQTPDVNKIIKSVSDMIPVPKDGKDGKDAQINKDEIINEIIKRIPRRGGGGGGSTVVTDDLSSQVNGTLKTFTTTKKIGTPLLLISTQFPTALRPTVDYTNTLTSITLASGVDAPASGQTLIFIYVEG